MLFFWDELKRQIRIEGQVTRLSEQESSAYFESRPIKSQIAATCSRQSQPIESREKLDEQFAQIESEHKNAVSLKKPANWGGFSLRPNRFEFWKGQSTRLHDRLVFHQRTADEPEVDGQLVKIAYKDWVVTRLQP
jgi:pyridoxamine 5'-phosphate oxidase